MKVKKVKNKSENQTDPILLKAKCMLSSYVKSTGAITCITDHNHITIPEIFDEITSDNITCLYCMKHQLNMQINKHEDYKLHPCRTLHIDNMKKSLAEGGSSCYTCDLGFTFWTSPVYSGRQYIGSLTGSGFICGDKNEIADKMELLGKGAVKKQEILNFLSKYPQKDKQHVKAMAELMLVCAETVSHDSTYQETLKRRNEQQRKIIKNPEKTNGKNTASAPASQAQKYPAEKEKAFLKSVSCGDMEKSLKLLYDLLETFLLMYPNDFKKIQFRVMELAIILSRTENTYNFLSYKNNQYIKSIERAVNLDELVDTIYLMTEYMTGEAFSFKGIRHTSALKKADRFIQSNYTRKLSLDEIAAASGLSAPYFSTIFREEMGENLSNYLNRLRMEKACNLLVKTDMMINKIGAACGIDDQSWFSKLFRNYTGTNPGQFRRKIRNLSMEKPVIKLSPDYQNLLSNQTENASQ